MIFLKGRGLAVWGFRFAVDIQTMTKKYQQLLKLLDSIEYKINEFSAFRSFNYNYSKMIENSQLYILEKHLETELTELSQMFDVRTKSAIILLAMFFNSFTNSEGLVSRIASEEDLLLAIGLDSHIILEFQEAFLELESKNILKINILDDTGNRSYQLTLTFINKIKF